MFKRGFKTWCENVAIQQRRELGLQSVDPLEPWRLAEHLEVQVWTPEQIPALDPSSLRRLVKEDPDGWSAVTIHLDSKDLIILNSAHRGGRPASDLAHELSHIIIDHKPSRVDITEDGLLMLNTYNKDQEDEANWLTGCLLLPRDAVMLIRRQNMHSQSAARRYGVSLEMLRYRLNVTGVNFQLSRMKTKPLISG